MRIKKGEGGGVEWKRIYGERGRERTRDEKRSGNTGLTRLAA